MLYSIVTCVIVLILLGIAVYLRNREELETLESLYAVSSYKYDKPISVTVGPGIRVNRVREYL